MKAYWVVRARISDPDEYGIYRELAGPVVAAFNGAAHKKRLRDLDIKEQ